MDISLCCSVQTEELLLLTCPCRFSGRFYVPSGTESVSVSISGCRRVDSSAPPEDAVHPCVGWVALRPDALPSQQTTGAGYSGSLGARGGVLDQSAGHRCGLLRVSGSERRCVGGAAHAMEAIVNSGVLSV